jgi:hypothetical protein
MSINIIYYIKPVFFSSKSFFLEILNRANFQQFFQKNIEKHKKTLNIFFGKFDP